MTAHHMHRRLESATGVCLPPMAYHQLVQEVELELRPQALLVAATSPRQQCHHPQAPLLFPLDLEPIQDSMPPRAHVVAASEAQGEVVATNVTLHPRAASLITMQRLAAHSPMVRQRALAVLVDLLQLVQPAIAPHWQQEEAAQARPPSRGLIAS